MNTIRDIESALIYFLYWVFRVAAFPLLVFYFLYRSARDRRYWRHFSERLGARPVSFPPTAAGAVWLHAVSVGEVVSAVPLLQQLRERSPRIRLYVSVGTVAGRGLAEEKLAGLADSVFYAPIDYAFAVRRVLRRIRPALVVILETEIWPVFYRETKRAGCGLLVVNGRMSDRASSGYRRARPFFRHVLRWPDMIFAQSEQDRRRYIEAGAPPEKVEVLGNIKYDAAPARSDPPQLVVDLLDRLKPAAVWIAASTMPGADSADVDEDDAVLSAFQELVQTHAQLLLILVPRKPERFDAAEQKLRAAGVPYLRRSQNTIEAHPALPCVLLLDSIGELASLFPLADIVFMGGSLARRGGHNLLEPAACGRPIIAGPHMENFAAIAGEFRDHYSMLEIGDASELAGAVAKLIDDPRLREDLGVGAAQLAARHGGASNKAVDHILKWRDLAVPCWQPHGPVRLVLWPLAKLWTAVSGAVQNRNLAHARRLDTPVISIGGISMGGVGKTPMVDYLAERLHLSGRQPAILTRGYRRRSIDKSILIAAGRKAPASLTGDEAQVFVHSGYAHTGIGADRWSTGRLLEEKLRPDLFLLDDGFQHRRLARDLDIVLIDALDPFAGCAAFPLGRLREPLTALAAADVFVIMRAAPGRDYQGIHRQLRTYNSRAPIFHAAIQPRYWVHERTQNPGHPPEGPAAAFCGLANPAAFWQTLESQRIRPAFTWEFGDHHSYKWKELQRLAAHARMHGSNVLLTTEKDAMNLPERAAEILTEASVDLYWLKIGLQIPDESGLLELIDSRLRP
ncbi:MAG TPA: tetraacyldisaccharide 4'-kinase [Bryobacteraceae bacterium]|nr:tetraacyldisaccharide 4'-kinase [Bryobacteraceae bacterium]